MPDPTRAERAATIVLNLGWDRNDPEGDEHRRYVESALAAEFERGREVSERFYGPKMMDAADEIGRARREGEREGRAKGLEEALTLAEGSHDYNGGNTGESLDAFHQGVSTVVRVLLRFIEHGLNDTQTVAVYQEGQRAREARDGR